MKRRDFLKTGVAGAAASASLTVKPTRSHARTSANEEVSLALMGAHRTGRGIHLARFFGAMPDVKFPYVCDVDRNVVEPVISHIEQAQG